MKRQNYGPRLGKLVFQLPRDVTLAYYLCLMHMIHHQKALSEDYNFRHKYHSTKEWIFMVKFVVLRQIFLMMYHVCQTEIVCQSYVPGKLKHQFTQMGPIVLVLHLLWLGFWMFRVFHCFSIINRPSSLIVTQLKGLQPPHLFSEISYQRPSQFISILSIRKFQFFDINEMKCYFHCIFVFMVICVLCCVPA